MAPPGTDLCNLNDMEDLYAQFKLHNESKNIFKAARTPAVFFAVAVFFYVCSGIFGLFGFYSFANICNFIMGVSLITLITWSYVRYSGEMLEIGETLDLVASALWENLLKPSYEAFVEKSIEHAVINSTLPAITKTTLSRTTSINGKHKQS
uniref:Uncharacterized protein n=1 Tax=Rhodnius prolixus TaxID=13249 RepID=T1I7F9_RHOPR